MKQNKSSVVLTLTTQSTIHTGVGPTASWPHWPLSMPAIKGPSLNQYTDMIADGSGPSMALKNLNVYHDCLEFKLRRKRIMLSFSHISQNVMIESMPEKPQQYNLDTIYQIDTLFQLLKEEVLIKRMDGNIDKPPTRSCTRCRIGGFPLCFKF